MTTLLTPKVEPAYVLAEQDRGKKAAMMQYLAQKFRLDVWDILHDKGTGHWGGASSVAEILTTLYFDTLSVRPSEPRWPDRDRLVLSKGHASAILYTVLANRGFFPTEELHTFRQIDSRLQGHPCMNETPGVDMSTGALGHGMSVSLGMALAARLQEADVRAEALDRADARERCDERLGNTRSDEVARLRDVGEVLGPGR